MILRPKSLKARLFLGFFSFTAGVLIVASLVLYYEVKSLVFGSVDKTLHSKSQLINGLLHEEHGRLELELTEVVHGEYSIPRSGHYYKVLLSGQVLAVAPSVVHQDFDLAPGNPVSVDEARSERFYMSTGPAGEPIRVLRHDFICNDLPVTVFVGESMEESIEVVRRFGFFLLVLIPLAIVAGGVLIFWITKKSLTPLESFAAGIENITHKTLDDRIKAGADTTEVVRLAVSFNNMMDKLQRAFETEKRIISDASHELKTPVSIIRAQCDVFLQKERTQSEYREALEAINSVSKNMIHLINNLLSLARLDSGLLELGAFKPVLLDRCLEEVSRMIRPIAEKKDIYIQLDCDEKLNVSGDESRLTEAFLNIVDNAVKYNKNGGTVLIKAEADEGKVSVNMSDSGIGISEGNLNRIFERFYRVDATGKIEGSGLGLSIAKTIIETHGGTIQMESDFGHGSTVHISLPLEIGS